MATKSLAGEVAELGQTVLVLQGGGALGAYQVGVYEALHEAGIAPEWVIGTSIGAINAALIVGSKAEERLEKLCEFWSRVTNDMFVPGGLPAWLATVTRNMLAITGGVPSFFSPNPLAFASPHYNLGAESAGYYSVSPLRRTLEDLIDVSIVDPYMLENGWEFKDRNGGTQDHLFGSDYLWQVYTRADPKYSGRVTVPVLWDKKRQTIVSNESAEIIRMFNSAFNHLTGSNEDFYPADLHSGIDMLNAMIYDTVNNGVYKCGFATTQEAYESHIGPLFNTLEQLEKRLEKNRYLMGAQLTEADWRLFTTLIRFDPVYVGHFKCNIRRIADHPNLFSYMRELYQMPGIAETVDFYHIKTHYYGSHRMINTTGIVPPGPEQKLDAPHGREHM